MSYMSDKATRWFKDRLAEKKLSQRGLARLLGVDAAAVSLMLRGLREMKIDEAKQIAVILGVSVEEVLAHVSMPITPKSQPVPIIGFINGNSHVEWGDDLGSVPRPTGTLPLNVAAIQCRTAGDNALSYMDRWLLFVPYPIPDGVAAECIDRLSVVCSPGGECNLALVKRGYAPGRWNLRGPAVHADETELRSAAPVLLITT
jgi:hypothetical protein